MNKNVVDMETSDLDENEFLVDEIVDYTRENNNDLYLVKWKGWSSNFNSWEPETNLRCPEVVAEFFKNKYIQAYGMNRRSKSLQKSYIEQGVADFERKFLQLSDEDLVECFTKFSVNGKLEFGDQLKPLPEVHKEVANFMHGEHRRRDQPLSKHTRCRLSKLRRQLLMHRTRRLREEQLQRLQEWQARLRHVSREQGLIIVENLVDLALPPDRFTFVNDCVPGVGVTIPSDPVIGCECSSCGNESSSGGGSSGASLCCAPKADAKVAYTRHGKLRIDVGEPIYECNSRCKCSSSCFNRVVQHGRKIKVAIFRTANGCGWGVKTLEPIKRGTFVSEYVGEVITSEEAERRGQQYDDIGVTYLFDLDYNDSCNMYTVDATLYGNVSHFINHSCDPNLTVYSVWVNCLDPNLPRLALFTCRDVARGEQLTFDYKSPLGRPQPTLRAGDEPSTSSGAAQIGGLCSRSPGRALSPRRMVRNQCLCGAKNCRKYLF